MTGQLQTEIPTQWQAKPKVYKMQKVCCYCCWWLCCVVCGPDVDFQSILLPLTIHFWRHVLCIEWTSGSVSVLVIVWVQVSASRFVSVRVSMRGKYIIFAVNKS